MTYNYFQMLWCDAQGCFGFRLFGENTVWLWPVLFCPPDLYGLRKISSL